MPFRTCGPPQNHNLFLDTCQNRVDAKTACLLRFRFFTFLWVLSQSFKNPNYTKTYLLSSNPSPAQNSPHGEHLEPRIEEFPSGTYLSTNRLLLRLRMMMILDFRIIVLFYSTSIKSNTFEFEIAENLSKFCFCKLRSLIRDYVWLTLTGTKMNTNEWRSTRGIRRRKAVFDLNVALTDLEGTSASVRASPIMPSCDLQRESEPSHPPPAMIDVDAIEDDVVESSASAFAEVCLYVCMLLVSVFFVKSSHRFCFSYSRLEVNQQVHVGDG